MRERSGSVVECLTRDRRAAGSSLTGVTVLWSLSKTHLSQLSTGSTQEDPSRITERLLSGRKESNQTKNKTYYSFLFELMLHVPVNNFSVMSGHFPARAESVLSCEDRASCSSGSSLIWIHIVCNIG